MDNPLNQEHRQLAPFADMFNHSPDITEAVHLVSDSGVSVFAAKDYQAGDQVCIVDLVR